MQNDVIDQFESLFLGVAETNPQAATRIAAALFTMARETDKADALFAVCDPEDNASGGINSHACSGALLELAEQLTAAGLPIPALLEHKLAAAAEQLQAEAAAHRDHAYTLLGYLNARRQAA